jgi:hypothetical protein
MGASESRSWLHILRLAAVLAVTIYVIVDLEYPRLGFFQISDLTSCWSRFGQVCGDGVISCGQ